MRITTALKPAAASAWRIGHRVIITAEAIIVTVRLRRRRRICAGCGQTGRHLQIHGRRVKRWRHLDLGASRCIIECPLRRLRCPACGIHLELEDPALAPAHLDAWLAWASRSRLAPFIRLARTIRRHRHRHGILAAIRLGLSKRPPRRTQQPHPPHQPPQLRLSFRRTADLPRLPLLRRHRHLAPTMIFTTK